MKVFSEPETTILGPQEVFLSKGSTLSLTCVVRGGPKRQPFIMWTHDSKVEIICSDQMGGSNFTILYSDCRLFGSCCICCCGIRSSAGSPLLENLTSCSSHPKERRQKFDTLRMRVRNGERNTTKPTVQQLYLFKRLICSRTRLVKSTSYNFRIKLGVRLEFQSKKGET